MLTSTVASAVTLPGAPDGVTETGNASLPFPRATTTVCVAAENATTSGWVSRSRSTNSTAPTAPAPLFGVVNADGRRAGDVLQVTSTPDVEFVISIVPRVDEVSTV